jgi:replicative DNA helicase
VNLALQECIARGVEVVAIHHQRKEQSGAGKPRALADVYGSTWITAGAGSVILLWGEPGDPVVELRHLKQPAEEVGPMRVSHDHAHGTTTIHDAPDLLELLKRGKGGISAPDAARCAVRYLEAKPAPDRESPPQTRPVRRERRRHPHRGEAARSGALHAEGAWVPWVGPWVTPRSTHAGRETALQSTPAQPTPTHAPATPFPAPT